MSRVFADTDYVYLHPNNLTKCQSTKLIFQTLSKTKWSRLIFKHCNKSNGDFEVFNNSQCVAVLLQPAVVDPVFPREVLLAMIALSVVQSSAQTHIHNAVLFIDTSRNA